MKTELPAIKTEDILFCKSYYNDKGTREICHNIKDGDKSSIDMVAKSILKILPQNSILIPIPSSCGYSTYTKDICNKINSFNKNISVLDVLKCNKRIKLYDLKNQSIEPNKEYFNFKLDGKIPNNKNIILIDNVFATGTTYKFVKEIIPNAKIAVFAFDETKHLNFDIKKEQRRIMNSSKQFDMSI